MVHIYCLNEDCRTIIHLDSHSHWDYKGPVKCKKCGAEMEVEIKNGEIVSQKHKRKH